MLSITAEELAKIRHKFCEEEAPKCDPPVAMLPWDDLEEWQRKLKIKIATRVLEKLKDGQEA